LEPGETSWKLMSNNSGSHLQARSLWPPVQSPG
jgi:hypothetical protein